MMNSERSRILYNNNNILPQDRVFGGKVSNQKNIKRDEKHTKREISHNKNDIDLFHHSSMRMNLWDDDEENFIEKRKLEERWKGYKDLFLKGNLDEVINVLDIEREKVKDKKLKRSILLLLAQSYLLKFEYSEKKEKGSGEEEDLNFAEYCLKDAEELSEDDTTIHYLRSEINLLEKSYFKAEEILKDKIEKYPLSGIEHFHLAKFYEKRGRLKECLSQYKWAVEVDGKNPRFRVGLVRTLLKMNKNEEAEVQCKILYDKCNMAELHILYARVLNLNGKPLEAKKVLKTVFPDEMTIIMINDELSNSQVCNVSKIWETVDNEITLKVPTIPDFIKQKRKEERIIREKRSKKLGKKREKKKEKKKNMKNGKNGKNGK